MDFISTLSAAKVSAFLHDIGEYGVSCEQILRGARLNETILQYPDHRITSLEFRRVLHETVRLTGNEDIGLLQGKGIARGFSNIVGYVLMNCRTLGEAADKYCKYEKIVDGTSITELQKSDGQVCLKCTTIDEELKGNRQFSDFRAAGILTYTKLLTGTKTEPVQIQFSYPRPSEIAAYERIFGCPVYFGRDSDILTFRQKDMEQTVMEPNGALLADFEDIARKTLKRFGIKGIYTGKVTDILLQEIRGETPAIGRVAELLSMSIRNLQLCLRREGTSYSALVDEIRQRMAVSYLKDRTISTDEIAYVLGFSESSAFQRAFKRWTNITPGAYRDLLSGRQINAVTTEMTTEVTTEMTTEMTTEVN
ncbi:MAG: AraC family transcriptional regulator [Clostridiaceae bacterium]|nr:AraC family transcriptional regulator [Clostridiaceae bacterium]